MSFLLKWLGLNSERSANIGLRPSRTLDLAIPFDLAFERCIDGLENDLGAIVRDRNQQAGTIDASFGLTFSERIACRFTKLDQSHTSVRIESHRSAQAELPKGTQALDRLAQFLMQSDPR